MSATRPTARGRLRLLLVIALFATPVLLAYGLYFSGWRPAAAPRVHGELVTPARPVADVALRTLDGQDMAFSAFRRQWLLLYVGSSECPAACEHALINMRQVIAAQGRQAHRVRAAMVVTDTRALSSLRQILSAHPELTALTGAPQALRQLAQDLELPGALAGQHRTYVIDPLGNFMLSYPADADANGMRKDLERLLRYSQVG
jgi:cytochrome oxidase Cu insertion factor (SCO1/SenC/PrrC family)